MGFPSTVFSIATGALPDGLALDPDTGVISGTPTTLGTFAFTVFATNTNGNDTAAYSITVGAQLAATGLEVEAPLIIAGLLLALGAGLLAFRRRTVRTV